MRRKALFIAAPAALAALALLAAWAAGAVAPGQRPDENGVYTAGGHWAQAVGETDAESAALFGEKLIELKESCLTAENRAFYAIVPDKGFYLPGAVKPATDYAALFAAADGALAGSGIEKIDLTAALSLDDYLTTDGHWKQEALGGVLEALGGAMGFEAGLDGFAPHTAEGFIGAYGKFGANVPETVTWLTGEATEAALVDDLQHPEDRAVYDLAALDTEVPYDLFLNGASPLIVIESPLAATGRELVIFRDSYASALAPLLLGEYQKITLVDIRYMVSALLPQYLTFTDQDVLFLYSTYVVNESAMLR